MSQRHTMPQPEGPPQPGSRPQPGALPPPATQPQPAGQAGQAVQPEPASTRQPGSPARPLRVLVTGAGGPAAIAVMKSLHADPAVELIAADMDPWAAGLYLQPPGARTLLPAGRSPAFVTVLLERCLDLAVDIVVPTVDAELRPLAAARSVLARAGVALMLAPRRSLELTLDKLALARHCADIVRVPRTERLTGDLDPDSWTYPVIVKPRTGSGSAGISLVGSAAELAGLHRSADCIVQDCLPGAEYSIDVLADRDGRVVSAVPRLRAKVDSGISVAGQTIRDPELIRFGTEVVRATGLTYIANVQCRRDREDRPALLEVNPRAPGSLPLTIASGVDMPRMALDSLRGQALPARADFREVAMVRFLDERFVELGEVQRAAA
ncbi:MAG: ATP-grasp domain-containing protein [Streptosporangiaceae bacterium]|jgi:carbamoyl-phosphate synthase large subunit